MKRKWITVPLIILLGVLLTGLSIEKLSFEFEMINVGMAGAVIIIFVTAMFAVAEIKLVH